MRVSFAAQSRSDLRSIGLFIAGDNPGRARSFVDELRSACQNLKENPERFVVVRDLPTGPVRRMPHRSYSIFYQRRGNDVLILRIVHGATVTGQFLADLK